MSLVSVPQVNPNDEVTAASVNGGPNAIATVVNGNLDDTNVASLSGTKLSAGTVPASAMTADANPETRMAESLANFIASGCVWSTVSGLNGAMTSGVAYVQGKRFTVAAIASYAFTASRDTYIYITNTGSISYNPQTNGAAQPTTPSDAALVAKVVTGASSISSITALADRPVNGTKVAPGPVSTTTDANGWEVRDYGLFKLATKIVSSTQSKVRFEISTQSSSNLPVGVATYADVKMATAEVGIGTNSDYVVITRNNTSSSATAMSVVYMYLGPTGATSYTVPIKYAVIF